MNLDEYRALKAQEVEQKDSKEEQPNVQTNEGATSTNEQANQTKTEESELRTSNEKQKEDEPASSRNEETTPNIPEFIEVDGQKVSVEELKNGYLRQSDYTKKTQALAREQSQLDIAKKYYDAIQTNPELAEEMSKQFNLPHMTPEQAKIQELNATLEDLRLEKEITSLSAKYEDFNEREVLEYAFKNKMENLEDAYHIIKGRSASKETPVDIHSIKEQIRQELLKELQSTQVDTNSIIQSGGSGKNVPTQNLPQITQRELSIARNMRMTPQEYIKWRDK